MRYQTSRRCGNGIMVTGVVTIILGFLLLLLSQTKAIPTFN
jgi:predicted RND superfamily exporter protein